MQRAMVASDMAVGAGSLETTFSTPGKKQKQQTGGRMRLETVRAHPPLMWFLSLNLITELWEDTLPITSNKIV